MATKKQKITGYKIDFETNSLIMNYKFAAAAQEYGSGENKLMKKIQKDFPSLTIVVKAGREQKTPRPNKRLTYANMEKHIKAYSNAEELLNVFETVKAISLTVASPYKYVCDWFTKQFPNYKNAPIFKDGQLVALPADPPAVEEYKVKMAKAG